LEEYTWNTDITHLAFGVVRHKSPSVGEIGEHPSTGSFRTKDGAGSSLLKRKEQKRVKKKMMKKREKKREKIYE
jgi:hypothetical protein